MGKIQPKKNLGQHFLKDTGIASKIVPLFQLMDAVLYLKLAREWNSYRLPASKKIFLISGYRNR